MQRTDEQGTYRYSQNEHESPSTSNINPDANNVHTYDTRIDIGGNDNNHDNNGSPASTITNNNGEDGGNDAGTDANSEHGDENEADNIDDIKKPPPFRWWIPPKAIRHYYRGAVVHNLVIAQIMLLLVRGCIAAALIINFMGGIYSWQYNLSSYMLLMLAPAAVYCLIEPFLPFGVYALISFITVMITIVLLLVGVFISAFAMSPIWVNNSVVFGATGFLFGYGVYIGRFEQTLNTQYSAERTTVSVGETPVPEVDVEKGVEENSAVRMCVISSGTDGKSTPVLESSTTTGTDVKSTPVLLESSTTTITTGTAAV